MTTGSRVDPEVEVVLERLGRFGRPALHERPLEDARADHDSDTVWVSGPGQEVARVEDRTVPGPGGPIPVRVYWPAGADGAAGPGAAGVAESPGGTEPCRRVEPGRALPVVAYFHGGGWVLGSIDSFDGVCRALANAAGAIVVSAGYRLAPENPFPAAAEDAVAVGRWLAACAAELGGDPGRLAVAGDSAGGNLATVAARHLRDDGTRVALQVLVYPVTGCHRDDEDEAMRWMWRSYLGDADGADGDPDATPLAAELGGMAPALVLCAEQDALRGEAEAYAAALTEAGVTARLEVVPGTTHGFWRWLALCAVSRRTVDAVGAALRDALA
jgi:acetyl esterase